MLKLCLQHHVLPVHPSTPLAQLPGDTSQLTSSSSQGVGGEEALSVNSEIPMLVPYYNRRPDHTKAALCRVRDEHITHDKLSYMHMISQVRRAELAYYVMF